MLADPIEATVGELAAAVRNGQISPRELLEAHIAHLERVNPLINAMAESRIEAARREAKEAETRLRGTKAPGELPPLLGVPCTVKEFFAVDGMRQTGGLLAARDYIARENATVIDRLRAAGAVIMATTNVPEGGMWMETNNLIHGRTNNPWNVKHTPGGSSGGEAALVAAGASPFGLGSDIGGSVRIPAAFCGVASHKPSGRMVPNTGHWGPEGHGTGPFLTAGPIARSAADLGLLLGIIAGPDGRDPFTEAWAIGETSDVDTGDISVFALDSLGGLPYDNETLRACERVLQSLVARGATRKPLAIAGLDKAAAIWTRAMHEAADGGPNDSFAHVLGGGDPINLLGEVSRAAVGRRRFTWPALGFLALEKLTTVIPESMTRDVPRASELADRIDSILSGRGVIIHPTYTRAAPRHHRALLTPFHAMSTAVWNVLEMPASQVPTGFSSSGLPLGVQVIAARGNDHVAIAIAQAIEEDFGRLGAAPLLAGR